VAKHTDVEDGRLQFDVAKVTGTLLHILKACCARKSTIDGAESRVTQTLVARALFLVILSHMSATKQSRLVLRAEVVDTHHRLWIENLHDAHVLDLFGREQTKLDFLDGLERRARVCELKVSHDCG
jgi:hypothetical protein